mgnify:CR=1 FL=1
MAVKPVKKETKAAVNIVAVKPKKDVKKKTSAEVVKKTPPTAVANKSPIATSTPVSPVN